MATTTAKQEQPDPVDLGVFYNDAGEPIQVWVHIYPPLLRHVIARARASKKSRATLGNDGVVITVTRLPKPAPAPDDPDLPW